MQIARVVGTLVSTQKHRKFEGAKLLMVQPLNLDDTPKGAPLLAVDGDALADDEGCGGEHRNGHARHAKHIATDGSGGMAQALEGLDKAHAGHQVQQCHQVHAHD